MTNLLKAKTFHKDFFKKIAYFYAINAPFAVINKRSFYGIIICIYNIDFLML